jgi:endonuclease/exonuclease/phosphatase family metal-dependent hydrolase
VQRGVSTVIAVFGVIGLLSLVAWWMGAGGAGGGAAAVQTQAAESHPAAAAAPADGSLRLMTVNIRMDDPKDGENAWPKRRELLVKTVLARNPDVVGCQEVSPVQGAYLIKEMHGFAHYPHGKAEGNENLSEMAAQVEGTLSGLDTVFYRDNRWELLEGANGLVIPNELQDNPTENTFFALLFLRDRAHRAPDLIVVNTHLRHGPAFAAKCAARLRGLIAVKLKKHPDAEVVLMGDLNHDRTEKMVYEVLAGTPLPGQAAMATDGAPMLKDTFDYSRKKPKELWGNWHNFTGKASREWPSDLIFVRGVMEHAPAELVLDKSVEAGEAGRGRYPSDHFFVWTTLTPR